jgi:thioredoxin-related protein
MSICKPSKLFIMIRYWVLVSLLLVLGWPAEAQQARDGGSTGSVQWRNWSSVQAGSPRQKVMVFIYADWCALCRRMESEVFGSEPVAQRLRQFFIPVRFNSEHREPMVYQGSTYEYISEGDVRYHGLAAKLMGGRISYPGLVFLDESGQVIQALSGFRNADDLLMALTYFGENHYKTTPWSTFQRNYRPD